MEDLNYGDKAVEVLMWLVGVFALADILYRVLM